MGLSFPLQVEKPRTSGNVDVTLNSKAVKSTSTGAVIVNSGSRGMGEPEVVMQSPPDLYSEVIE